MADTRPMITALIAAALCSTAATAEPAPIQASTAATGIDRDALKKQAVADVEAHARLIQQMVDSLFSFAEPGFQEFQTMDYLTGILKKEGFTKWKRIEVEDDEVEVDNAIDAAGKQFDLELDPKTFAITKREAE